MNRTVVPARRCCKVRFTGGLRKLVATALLVAVPATAQLPPAPKPVPGGLLDSRPEMKAAPPESSSRTKQGGERRRAKGSPKAPAWATERPDWVRTDPRVVATFTGDDLAKKKGTRVRNGVATKSLEFPEITWWSSVRSLPAQSKACATVFLKLHSDFRPGNGGKLPGFSNTGLGRRHTSSPEVVNGRKLPNTGWGGRKPDGVHWSARSGFGKWDENGVRFRTYFYAMSPKNPWGHIDRIGDLPKGKWTAYIQCLKLNTPGVRDGGLYYEVVGEETIYARDDIRWRDEDVPQSMIREFWINFYCGGTKCGDGDPGTVSLGKVLVTRGLPDMAKVSAELARLRLND